MAKKKRMSNSKHTPERRSRTAGGIMLVVTVLILAGLGVRFSDLALSKSLNGHPIDRESRQGTGQKLTVPARRGEIYDTKGTILGENTTKYTLAVSLGTKQNPDNPVLIPKDEDKVIKALAKTLDEKEDVFRNQIAYARKQKLAQTQFGAAGRNLDADEYKRLMKQKLPGVSFTTSTARYYPNGVFASNLIGFANMVEDEKTGKQKMVGQMGIEAGWNKELEGKDGEKLTTLAMQEGKRAKAAESGKDIYTTLNSKLQMTLEEKMSKLDEHMAPKGAVAILMDAKTGKIVAETQRPTFNASTGEGIDKVWNSELVSNQLEPGSVMKGITVAAAIDSGNWDKDKTYPSGRIKVGDQVIGDWNHGQGWGQITYNEGIARSSNVAMVLTERKMGSDLWKSYIQRFGFLKSTDLGLPNEAHGQMPFRYEVEKANTSFGQGINVTPIQMMQAYTAIAGDGNILQPQIIDRIVDPNTKKVTFEAKREVKHRAISAKAAKETREALEGVVYSDEGLGSEYAIPGVRVAGKSGTAQISDSNGYLGLGDNSKEIHSWMGMAPADNPRYLMYIVVKQPQRKGEVVSTEMSDVFKPVMEQALKLSEADEDQTVNSQDQEIDMPTLKGGTTKAAKDMLKAKGLTPVIMGNGQTVQDQYPAGGERTLGTQQVFLNTGKAITVPNMHGWSKNDVMIWGELAKIDMNMQGNGFVMEQSVLPGTRIDVGVHDITLKLKQPASE